MEIKGSKANFSLGNMDSCILSQRRDTVILVFPSLIYTIYTVNMQRGHETLQQYFYRILLSAWAIADLASTSKLMLYR